MKTRLDEVPTLRETTSTIQAARFNTVRLALLRLGKPLRIELEGLRHLDMLLDDDLWVVVDRNLNDLPVVAWSEFHRENRSALNEPVHCRTRLYHSHANIIIDTALKTVESVLGTYLAAESADAPHEVTRLPRAHPAKD